MQYLPGRMNVYLISSAMSQYTRIMAISDHCVTCVNCEANAKKNRYPMIIIKKNYFFFALMDVIYFACLFICELIKIFKIFINVKCM